MIKMTNKLEINSDQVKRLEDGDNQEWNSNYDSIKSFIMSILIYRNCEIGLAEDIAHNTMTKLLNKNLDIQNTYALKNWLVTVSLNDFFDNCRKSLAHPLDQLEPEPVNATPIAQHRPRTIDQAESYIDLDRSIRNLTPPQKEVLGLWSIGYSYLETAEIIGETYQVVRARASRGVNALRPLMTSSLDKSVLTR